MIRRTEHSNDKKFTIITRALAQNKDLSFQARGLLLYLLSKPSKWEVRNQDLCKQGEIGKAALATILEELRTKGYLKRFRERSAGGEFSWISEVFEEPQVNGVQPYTDNRGMAPCTDLPSTVNKGMALIDDRAGARTAITDETEKHLSELSGKSDLEEAKPRKIKTAPDRRRPHLESKATAPRPDWAPHPIPEGYRGPVFGVIFGMIYDMGLCVPQGDMRIAIDEYLWSRNNNNGGMTLKGTPDLDSLSFIRGWANNNWRKKYTPKRPEYNAYEELFDPEDKALRWLPDGFDFWDPEEQAWFKKAYGKMIREKTDVNEKND